MTAKHSVFLEIPGDFPDILRWLISFDTSRDRVTTTSRRRRRQPGSVQRALTAGTGTSLSLLSRQLCAARDDDGSPFVRRLSCEMPLSLVYSLRDDTETVGLVDRATLETQEYGLEPDPVLFGSADWWAAIERGDLPTHQVSGQISSVYWGSMNDHAEFELRTQDGETSAWTRLGDHTRYVEGLDASVSFVEQRSKAEAASRHGLCETKEMLEIRVEESPLRSSRYAPGPFLTDAPWKSKDYLAAVRARFVFNGADVQPGLSDAEIEAIESEFGFRFPPDLRYLLQVMVPVSNGFPDWRGPDRTRLRGRLDWPADGICFDVEHSFWLDDWGDRPADLADALRVARERVREAPVLIPVYGHRYVPAEPYGDGNPVFSVYQTDIIHFGADLPSYFVAEFGLEPTWWAFGKPRPVRFWDRLVS